MFPFWEPISKTGALHKSNSGPNRERNSSEVMELQQFQGCSADCTREKTGLMWTTLALVGDGLLQKFLPITNANVRI